MIQRKNLTICFNQLFKDALRLCNDFLDPIATSLAKKNSAFVNTYLTLRTVKEADAGVMRIRGSVKTKHSSAAADEPASLPAVSITLVETGVMVKSDGEGNFSFRINRKGIYTVRAEKEGFYTKTSPKIALKDGESADVEFILLPSEILQD